MLSFSRLQGLSSVLSRKRPAEGPTAVRPVSHKEIATVETLNALHQIDPFRRHLEDHVQAQTAITGHCCICDDWKSMTIRQSVSEWVDLRSEAVCVSCGHSSRMRLLYDCVMGETGQSDRAAISALLFERVTSFYDTLKQLFPKMIGVEFGGADLTPGTSFHHKGIDVRHEDMQRLSFDDDSLDVVIHSDVLEHVPEPLQGMREIYRVLKPGGKCIFACPIYSVMDHVQRAYIEENGDLTFTNGPCFHGDPLRDQGIPVFYEFGLSLIDDLRAIGFQASYTLKHSLTDAYFSNNNQFTHGHMWPLVVVCRK